MTDINSTPPGIRQTSPGRYTVDRNISVDYMHFSQNSQIIVSKGAEIKLSSLTLDDSCTLQIEDGIIRIDSCRCGDRLRVTGRGIITVGQKLTCGEGSHIDLSDISLELSATDFEVGDRSTIRLDSFPVKGGTLSSKGTAFIEAPCRPLLYGTALNGRWKAEKAYPEWFAAEEPSDWAVLINRALEISQDGVTYLQNQTYNVSSTIYVPTRGQLIGTLSGKRQGSEIWGSRIVPVQGGSFDAGSIITVNILKSAITGKTLAEALGHDGNNRSERTIVAQENYPHPGARIGNMTIYNSNGLNNLNAILIAYTAEVDSVIFSNLTRCICWTSDYADLKKVTRCVINNLKKTTDTSNINSTYAIDFNFLGDALIFEGNALHGIDGENLSSNYSYKMVRISTCFGGSVTSNIINGDVLVTNSKGILFSNNHLNYGAQVEITDSEITVANNFFEKGTRPNIVINSGTNANAAVVNLTGNQYLYLADNERPKIKSPLTGSTDLQYAKTNVSELCDYDILVASQGTSTSAIVNISNELRYWTRNGTLSRMYPMGISVYRKTSANSEPVPVEEFRWRSHILSRSSSLIFTPAVKAAYPSMTVTALSAPKLSVWGMNDNIPWFGNNGTFSYTYQIIWDYGKQLISQSKNAEGSSSVTVNSGSHGVLINLFAAAESCGNQLTMRVIKTYTSGVKYYVDIPIVGSTVLYDDGNALGTYKWKQGSSSAILSGNLNVSTITYAGDKIITTN